MISLRSPCARASRRPGMRSCSTWKAVTSSRTIKSTLCSTSALTGAAGASTEERADADRAVLSVPRADHLRPAPQGPRVLAAAARALLRIPASSERAHGAGPARSQHRSRPAQSAGARTILYRYGSSRRSRLGDRRARRLSGAGARTSARLSRGAGTSRQGDRETHAHTTTRRSQR